MSLQPSTLLAVLHDLIISLAGHGFERIFVVNGHGGNIATTKASFAQAYRTASTRSLPVAKRLRCRLSNWFMASSVFQHSRDLYGDKEGQHATPSEIALTLHLESSLLPKQRPLPVSAPAGPIYGPEDFRLRYPDGRMGSEPFLASAQDGKTLLEKAVSELSNELSIFLKTP